MGVLHWLQGDGIDDFIDTGLSHQTIWAGYIAVRDIVGRGIFGGRSSINARFYFFNESVGLGNDTFQNNFADGVLSLSTKANNNYEAKQNNSVALSGIYGGNTQPGASNYIFALNNVTEPDFFTSGKFYGAYFGLPVEDDQDLINYLAALAGVTL